MTFAATPAKAFSAAPAAGAEPMALPNLDGLRAIACLLVVIAHLPMPWRLVSLGDTGVSIFFCLSGFLMAYLYGHSPWNVSTVSHYAIARFARIAPIYWAVIALCATLTLFDKNFVMPIDSGWQLMRHLLFGGSVGVFWSISPEVQFYGFFLLLWLALRGSGNRPQTASMVLLLCAALLLTHSMWPGLSLPNKLHLFLAGALAGLAPRPDWRAARSGVWLSYLQGAALLLLIATSWVFKAMSMEELRKHALYAHVEVALILALVIYLLSFDSRWTRAIFASRPLRAIGRASFSIYLLHQIFLHYGAQWLDLDPAVFAPIWLGVGVAAVLMSMWVSRRIEMPLQKCVRQFLEQWRTVVISKWRARWATRHDRAGAPVAPQVME